MLSPYWEFVVWYVDSEPKIHRFQHVSMNIFLQNVNLEVIEALYYIKCRKLAE